MKRNHVETHYYASLFCLLGLLSTVFSGFSQTQVSGTLSVNTTWTSGSHYVLTGHLTIRSGAVLTIQGNVTVDMASYNINVGSSTTGSLAADRASFFSAQTTDRKILIQDGGTCNLNACSFDDVYIDIDADAGQTLNITGSTFSNVTFPVTCDVNRVPVFTGNAGTPAVIGIGGTLTQNLALPVLQWSYALFTNVTVRSNAQLTLGPGIYIDLKSYTLAIGSSSAGELLANGAVISSSSGTDRKISLKDGGKATLTGCTFSNVFVDMDADAGTPVTLTGNTFSNAQYPVKANALNLPVMSGNMADTPIIGLKNNVTQSVTLPLPEWDYALSEAIYVRDQAILTILPGTTIHLNNQYLYIGSSATVTGTILADHVSFKEAPGKNGRIWFRDNSGGTFTHCRFEGTQLQLQGGSPTLSNSTFTHSKTAIYVNDESNPVLDHNDFFNNTTAIDHRGDATLQLQNNWWGHTTGPRNSANPGGEGEIIAGTGAMVLEPRLLQPANGSVSPGLIPPVMDLGYLLTGRKKDTAFIIRNNGDIDLLITTVGNTSSQISIDADDRFWILPDSTVRIPFSFTPLQFGIQHDTIQLGTNGPGTGRTILPVTAEGRVDDISLNFYHIDVDSFPVVKCHFSLTDQSFLPIRTLTRDNITVSEQRINIPGFELIGRTASRAVRVALVMDRSGSMEGIPLRDAKNAAIDFIRELTPTDKAAVVSFADNAGVDLGFSSDQASLIAAVNSLRAEGATALYDALDMSIALVRGLDGIRAVLALSDGQDNESSKTAADVINAANQAGINVYTIGLGRDADPSLEMMARQTGGQYFYSPTSKDLATIYRMISGQLQNLYVVRYVASEALPFPRRVELGVNVYGLADTAVRYYGMGNTEIEFSLTGQPFRRQDFATDSKGYFYYFVHPDSVEMSEGMTFTYYMNSNNHTIPCGGEYMGDGIMQFWADFRGINQTGSYPVSLPDSVSQSGGWIIFNPKPAPFSANLKKRPVVQSIDIFAGGSAGVKALAGAVGAGPSIAAASATASGTGGMGINFERNEAGDEWITRRLEAGVAGKVESPAINTVIDAVNVGVSAEVITKGTAGQTMLFPYATQTDATQIKAKAAYLLETLSYGGMVVSPYFGIVLNALTQALIIINPDVSAIYSGLNDSWNVGVSTEGKVAAEFKLTPAKNSGLPEFTLAEGSLSVGLGASFTHYFDTNDMTLGVRLAAGFDVGALNFKIGNANIGSVFKYKQGAEISVESGFNPSNGLTSFNMGFLTYNQASLTFLQGYYGHLYSVNVPEPVIEKAQAAASNMIHDVAMIFQPGATMPGLRLGSAFFSDALDAVFGFDEDSLGSFDDHIVLSTEEQYSKGINTEIKIALDAALVLGLGLEFGVAFSYLDKISALTDEYVLAQGKILPMAEYPGVTDQNSLFSVKNELTDLFDGAIDLVIDGVLNLIDLGEFLIDEGIEFISDLPENAGKLWGTAESTGKVVISVADPRNWFLESRPLMDPKIISAYWSPRVTEPSKPDRYKSGPEQSDLFVISKAVSVSLFNQSGEKPDEFSPLQLTLFIDENMLTDLGFAEEEKTLAKLYWYNPDNLSWMPFAIDLAAHPDSVGAEITRQGTYAVGIEIRPSWDKSAPEILEYYPLDGGSIAPQAKIWVKLFEASTGVGIDFSRTSLMIDGSVTDASWDPVNSVISYASPLPLSLGDHTFTIIATDYQGNSTNQIIPFKVIASFTSPSLNKSSPHLNIFPNPSKSDITVEIYPDVQLPMDIDVYDASGRPVFTLHRGTVLPGLHRFTWNRMTDRGIPAGAGVYFIRAKQGGRMEVKRVVLL